MTNESIDCSHEEWVYAGDRCALCGVTAFGLIAASQASFAAHMREAAAPRNPKEWANQVQEEFLKSEGGQLLQKIAFAAREAAEQRRMWEERAPLRAAIAREAAISVSISYAAWLGKQAAERAAASPRPAFPARALRMGSWTISDLVE